mmetsp:Transcript_1361/g.4263  ORF Transcript_1361/g.4263 Transcript_1361/m.4263 type:complete len:207 (+) Transcript_1361:981-1601(+)
MDPTRARQEHTSQTQPSTILSYAKVANVAVEGGVLLPRHQLLPAWNVHFALHQRQFCYVYATDDVAVARRVLEIHTDQTGRGALSLETPELGPRILVFEVAHEPCERSVLVITLGPKRSHLVDLTKVPRRAYVEPQRAIEDGGGRSLRPCEHLPFLLQHSSPSGGSEVFGPRRVCLPRHCGRPPCRHWSRTRARCANAARPPESHA